MKKIFSFFVLFIQIIIFGQTPNWDTALSQIYVPAAGFESKKVLLDKVSSFSDLYNFNEVNHNTSNASHFKQALSELNRASNNLYFNNYSLFPNFTEQIPTATSIPLGIISTKCAYLNYDEENNSNGNLYINNNVFYPINSSVPNFIEKDLVIVSPLYPAYTSNSNTFTFSINNTQWYQYINTITKLEVDFGNGVYQTLINNSVVVASSISVNIDIPLNSVKKQELTFRVTYGANQKITKSTIYLSKRINNQNTYRTGDCGTSQLLKHRSSIADNLGVFGEIEYKIFYGNNNATCNVKKPVIIVDGFDPGDKRRVDFTDCQNDARCLAANIKDNPNLNATNYKSISKLMLYDDGSPQNPNLIDKLNTENFDVIIVNLPYYNKVSGTTLQGEICAGADDVIRNGKTIASFIQKINADLQTVGSTEKLVVIGPSMGGLITRYALAYLEKNNINTNTKVWVSMDSPHQGANIPIAVQADMYFLGKVLKQQEAELQFDNLLHSKAAEQMLIDIVDYSGNANKNTTNVSFLNEIKNNGVPNSFGFPKLNNIKNISITNGSLDGHLNVEPLLKFLEVKASAKIKLLGVRVGRKQIFRLENRFMPNFNQFTTVTNRIANNLGRNPTLDIGATRYRLAHSNNGFNPFFNTFNTNTITINNINGSMDAVPGGTTNSANDLKDATIKGLNDTDGYSNQFISIITTSSDLIVDLNIPAANTVITPQTFIPMHSSLDTSGYSNWYQAINKNIVCTGQTRFDSFYGESYNMDHVSFTNNMVNWITKNLTIGLQAPYFPIPADALQGPDVVCLDSNSTFGFNDICKVPSEVTSWVVTSNLQIISQNGYNIIVKGLSNGLGKITAIFSNGLKVEKNIEVGILPYHFNNSSLTGEDYICGFQSYTYTLNNVNHPCVSTINWSVSPNLFIVSQTTNSVTVVKNSFNNQYAGIITANIPNSTIQIKKGVWVGVSNSNEISIQKIGAYDFYVGTWTKLMASYNSLIYPENGAYNLTYEWQIPSSLVRNYTDTAFKDVKPNIGGELNIGVRACNPCGCSNWKYQLFTVGGGTSPNELTPLKP